MLLLLSTNGTDRQTDGLLNCFIDPAPHTMQSSVTRNIYDKQIEYGNQPKTQIQYNTKFVKRHVAVASDLRCGWSLGDRMLSVAKVDHSMLMVQSSCRHICQTLVGPRKSTLRVT